MDRSLLLVSLGALAWFAGGLYYGNGALDGFMIGLVLIAVGFALAAWAVGQSPGLTAGGFLVALVGIVMFLGNGLFQFTNLARIGSHAFAVALLALAAGALLAGPRRSLALRTGAVLGLVASAFWIAADLDGGAAWQPGNALAAGGLALVLWRPPPEAAA